ncbi:tetratricopeptide repeat protein [Pelagibacteraceae bacterium]|nr:tetratricopeptide repeat protein [Pelagibacteraceae bacterium]
MEDQESTTKKGNYQKNHLDMKVMFRILISCIIILFFSNIAIADQNDPRLNNLFKKLNQTESQEEIRELISDIWNIWYEVDDPKVIEYFEKGIQAMNLRNYPLAIRFFNNLIEEDPNFAEGWNKRATVHFMMGNFDKSMNDIIKTLELEPRHFGALDGMGLIFIHQGQFQQAIDVYDKMLEIFPFSVKTLDKKERIQSFISQST